MSLPTTSLEARFCERMHEAGGDEWVYTKGENSKAVQDIMKCPVRAGWAISHALTINGPRKVFSTCRASSSSVQGCSSSVGVVRVCIIHRWLTQPG